MPLNLHKALKGRLIETLAQAFPLMEVRHGMFFAPQSRLRLYEANAALPDHGPLHDQLLNFVDDLPLITFGYDFLANELLRRDYDSENQLMPLTQIEGYTDPTSLASRVIDNFNSLPWRYVLTVKLPDDASVPLAEIIENERPLSKNISLAKATNEFSEMYPINSEDEKRQERIHGSRGLLMAEPKEGKWAEGSIYLKIQVDGYIGPYGGSAPALQAARSLKAFLGLGIALKLFCINHSSSGSILLCSQS